MRTPQPSRLFRTGAPAMYVCRRSSKDTMHSKGMAEPGVAISGIITHTRVGNSCTVQRSCACCMYDQLVQLLLTIKRAATMPRVPLDFISGRARQSRTHVCRLRLQLLRVQYGWTRSLNSAADGPCQPSYPIFGKRPSVPGCTALSSLRCRLAPRPVSGLGSCRRCVPSWRVLNMNAANSSN